MILHASQSIVASDLHRFRVLNCGRRFGKTELATEEMLGVAIAKKDRRIHYYAPTRDDARDIAWAILLHKCLSITTYVNESRLEMKVRTIDGGESLIALYGWEAVKDRGKGRGLSTDFIVCDEVSSYRQFWEGWDKVLSPTLIDRKGSAMFISTPEGFNHFYDLCQKELIDPDYKYFHFTSYDNPHIPKEEIDREKLSKPEDVFAQEYLADFRKRKGLVYKEFDRQYHIYKDGEFDPRTSIDTIVGIDWGYTNPATGLRIYIDNDNHYWVDEEYYERGKTTEEIVEYVKTFKATKYYPDPAEPDRIAIARKLGLNVRDVNKDVELGINAVRELLKQKRLHISGRCLNLISEFETYRYKDKREDNNEPEEPVKEDDHALDALRYALVMQATPGVAPQKSKVFYPKGHIRRSNKL